MFLIDKEIKKRNLPEHIRKHLTFLSPFEMKFCIAVSTFLLLDFCMIVPLLLAWDVKYVSVILPLIVIMNIWCIFLLCKNVYTIQFSTIRFLAVLGIVGCFCFFVLTQKMAYNLLMLEGPLFLLISILLLLSFILVILRYYFKKFSSIHVKWKEKETSKYSILYVGMSMATIIFLVYFLAKRFEIIYGLFLLGIFNIFVVAFAYIGIKFTHKYFFMKFNQHVLHYGRPYKKDKKNKNIEVR
ncbi:hypothetical protein V7068_22080 [Bacillus sp. JJ634]